MHLKKQRLSLLTLLPVLSIFFTGAVMPSQGMDWLGPGSQVVGWVGRAIKAGGSYLEVPKKPEEQFKEQISLLNVRDAHDIIQKEIRRLEQTIPMSPSYNGLDQHVLEEHKETALRLYNQMVIASLKVDYVYACLQSITGVINDLANQVELPNYKTIQYDLKEGLNFLGGENGLQEKLGAILCDQYKYTRGGGPLDRSITSLGAKKRRKKLWGDSNLSKKDWAASADYESKLKQYKKERDEENKHKNRADILLILSVYEKYVVTLELLSQHESVLLKPGNDKGISYYQDLLSKTFGYNEIPTPVTIRSDLFNINSDVDFPMGKGFILTSNNDQDEEKKDENEQGSYPTNKTQPIAIPKKTTN
ncbi:hypothetical protein [Candidatus Paracaedibacter symbiosus]|uniref:hypothetical protein n=1 Tax=Candidatus Paracaedibacter symbiosus TaxID=244582 RepID=UPI0005095457|nr:hypothetical protein [Candidatus Paracaedibacter symbiosus]